MQTNKHVFALSTAAQIAFKENSMSCIRDEDLWERITKILRLKAGEDVIIFNTSTALTLTLKPETFTTKNSVYGLIKENKAITPLQPNITLLQGIPKKSDFEDIIYNATQLGVATIVPVRTNKAVDLAFSPKELERFSNIMIAACEQAKQFCIPTLTAPISFEQGMTLSAETKILFDSNGTNCQERLRQLEKATHIAVLFGPEGGLTDQEIATAQAANFLNTKLTPTILRAKDAPLVGLGLMRTLIA
jgi:16S rRNA (uracil1498-N3)-methyltransferase